MTERTAIFLSSRAGSMAAISSIPSSGIKGQRMTSYDVNH